MEIESLTGAKTLVVECLVTLISSGYLCKMALSSLVMVVIIKLNLVEVEYGQRRLVTTSNVCPHNPSQPAESAKK